MKKILLPLLFISFNLKAQKLKIIDNFVYGTKESITKKEDLYDLITTKEYGDYSISDYHSEYLNKYRSMYLSYRKKIPTIPPFFTITKNVLILN